MLSFAFINPSFAMGGKVFTLARAMGVTAGPAFIFHTTYKNYKKKNAEQMYPISETNIEEWGREKMKQLNVPNYESMLFVCSRGEWATDGNKICVPFDCTFLFKDSLERALEQKKSPSKFFFNFLALDDSPDKIIARNSMILKHELGHVINQDTQNKCYALATIPLGIETLSFGVTKMFRKLFNMQPQPKTFLKTTLRSCSAIGSIGPKFLMSSLGLVAFSRYQETQADKFACEHAESRLELEEFAKYFKEHENSDWATKNRWEVCLLHAEKDLCHPAPIDRREMVESYIAQWDKDHAHEEGKRA
jgi:hypothetical protein